MKLYINNTEEELVTVLYNLILNKDVKEQEREIFINCKNELEETNNNRHIIYVLKNELRALAIKRQLSSPASEFLLEISRRTPRSTNAFSAIFESLIPKKSK